LRPSRFICCSAAMVTLSAMIRFPYELGRVRLALRS
jgi:hypothetical protein